MKWSLESALKRKHFKKLNDSSALKIERIQISESIEIRKFRNVLKTFQMKGTIRTKLFIGLENVLILSHFRKSHFKIELTHNLSFTQFKQTKLPYVSY